MFNNIRLEAPPTLADATSAPAELGSGTDGWSLFAAHRAFLLRGRDFRQPPCRELRPFPAGGKLQWTASRRGRAKRGRRRSAAIPPNALSWENVSKCDNILQTVPKCGKRRQHVRASSRSCKMRGICGPSGKAPFVPPPSGSR